MDPLQSQLTISAASPCCEIQYLTDMLCLAAIQARGSINCEVTISADANASFKMVNSDGTYTAPLLESTSRDSWSDIPPKHVQTFLKIL